MRARARIAALAVAWAAGLAGCGQEPAAPPDSAAGGAEVLRAAYPDLEGKIRALGQWRGKVLVVNFWATWCPPCREEIPQFVALQRDWGGRGLQFVGVAIDTREKVKPYAKAVAMNYPVLLADAGSLDLMKALGNPSGGLPFTVIVDREGEVVRRELGGLDRPKLEALLAPLL